MNNSAYKQETLVIEKPSKALVDLMNKLRDRKMAQLEELRNKKRLLLFKEIIIKKKLLVEAKQFDFLTITMFSIIFFELLITYMFCQFKK